MKHPFVLSLALLFLATCAQSQVSPLGIQTLGTLLGFGRGPGGGFRSPFRPPSFSGPPPPPPSFGGPIAAGSFGVPVQAFGAPFGTGGFGSPLGAPAAFGGAALGPSPFGPASFGSLIPSGSFSSPVSVSGFSGEGFDASDFSSAGDYVALGSSSSPFASEYDQAEDAPGLKRKDEDEEEEEQ